MTVDRVKRGPRSYFYKIPCQCSLFNISTKILVWNKIIVPTLNSQNLAELVVNEFMKSISKKIYNIPFSIRFVNA